jgi:hypothetical protein
MVRFGGALVGLLDQTSLAQNNQATGKGKGEVRILFFYLFLPLIDLMS